MLAFTDRRTHQAPVAIERRNTPLRQADAGHNQRGAILNDLGKLTDELLSNHDAVRWLRLADNYIQMYNKAPREFILPRLHAKVRPLIEIYANDLPGFVRYILGVRDSFQTESVAYMELHRLYRTISTRALQQERRHRVNTAVETALKARGTPASFETKQLWARRVEQEWGRRRMERMAEVRAKTRRNRLSVDERSQVLEDFWAEIDGEIARGELPPMRGE